MFEQTLITLFVMRRYVKCTVGQFEDIIVKNRFNIQVIRDSGYQFAVSVLIPNILGINAMYIKRCDRSVNELVGPIAHTLPKYIFDIHILCATMSFSKLAGKDNFSTLLSLLFFDFTNLAITFTLYPDTYRCTRY